MKITVLKGGWSSEREISLNSGENISKILKKAGHEVYEIDVIKNLKYITNELYNSNPDFIYNALHGGGGEDGTIQGILEVFGIPYSNSGVLSSAICFDKSTCKMLAQSSNINVPSGFCINANEIPLINNGGISSEYPFIIKPTCNGSSVGVFLIHDKKELQDIQNKSWNYGSKVLVEEFIQGREFTVLVNKGKSVGALEILFNNDFYNYNSKYENGASTHVSNYKLAKNVENEMFNMAETMFKICQCKGFVRIDFRYNGKNIYFLEINTQPGMTSTSLVPDIIKHKKINIETFLIG